jgi:hypothetical protein
MFAPIEYNNPEMNYWTYENVNTYSTAIRHLGTVHVSAGYRINPNATVGIGFGTIVNNRIRFLPITAEGTFCFLKKRITPYVNAGAGFSFAFRDPVVQYPMGGGANFSGRIGVKYYVVKELGLMFDLGYTGQQRYLYFPSNWFHGLEIRAGFIF